jgi:hypothetical protein
MSPKPKWIDVPEAGIAYTAEGRIRIKDKNLQLELQRYYYARIIEQLLGCCKKSDSGSGPKGGLGQPGGGGGPAFNGSGCGPDGAS